MHKRIIAFTLFLCILFSCSIGASASVPYTQGFATELIRDMDIMVGDSSGNMNLDSNLTRAEFTKIAIAASKYKNSVAHGAKISVFKDCNYKHWSAPYVKVAVTNGIISGYPDGTFKPDSLVTYEEAFVVMLKLLGYTSEDFGNTWPYGQVSLGKSIGLGANINKGIGDVITRGEALKLVYNTLNAKIKGTNTEYVSELDATLTENVIIIATNNEDTSVAPGSVLTSAGTYRYGDFFDPAFVGTKGDLAVKSNGDIICFSPYEQKNSKYVVYSILEDSVIFYKDGSLTELDISNNTTVYSGSEKTTFASAGQQLTTGDVVYVVKNSAGAVEYLKLTKDSLKGPETLSSYSSSWYRAFTDDLSTLSVMRNGEKVSHTDVRTNDILYYSKDFNTVFAYANTTTGIYEKAIPNKDTPTSVVVSGKEYQLESVNAFNKLSSSGRLSYGNSITLLLGKDGKVADAVMSEDATDEIAGVLVGAGRKTYENSNGENYISRYVSVCMTDGSTVDYETKSDYSNLLNSVVKISFNDGFAKLSKVSAQKNVYGVVDYVGMKIGSYSVSNDVEIIDNKTTDETRTSSVIRTYMSRLDGVELEVSSILWFDRNDEGEINKLILNDVTGDFAMYGLAVESPSTETKEIGGQEVKYKSGSNVFESGGNEYTYTKGVYNNIKKYAPVKFYVSQGNSVESASALILVNEKITLLDYAFLETSGKTYKISDKVAVYKKVNISTYNQMTMSELVENAEEYTVRAYYDKKEEKGGRIRVLIAQPK